MNSELIKLINILSSLKANSICIGNAEELVEEIDWASLEFIESVYGNLFHYWHDYDIRSKDSSYSQFQNSELDKLINHLKKQDYVKANAINFLSKMT